MPRSKSQAPPEEAPWSAGDATKKISLNLPFPEPTMMQLDYLIQHKAIRSKSSFIREAVEAACADEIQKLWRVREAVRRMEADESE